MDKIEIARLGHLNQIEMFRILCGGPAGEIGEEDGVLMLASGSHFPVLANTAFRLDEARDAKGAVDTARAWFHGRGRPFGVFVRSLPVDDDLDVAAKESGLVLALPHYPEMACLERIPDRPLPDGLELRRVDSPEGCADMVELVAATYPDIMFPAEEVRKLVQPPTLILDDQIMALVGYADGRLVTCALTLLSGGIAGVYLVATLGEARGRGFADAVTRAVTNAAFDAGAAATTLQPSSMGDPIYRRMVYIELYNYKVYIDLGPVAS